MSNNSDEFFNKLKLMKKDELNSYLLIIKVVDRSIGCFAIALILLALYFPNIPTVIAVSALVAISATLCDGISEIKDKINEYLGS